MEIWKEIPIPGTKWVYEISNSGKVRRLNKSYPKDKRKEKYWYMSTSFHTNGYAQATMTVDGKHRNFLVHRLVATTFIPNPENKPTVNHINGIKSDNRVENLEWATQQENIAHSFKSGLSNYKGERNGQSKLTDENVREIRALLKSGITHDKIAKKFKVKRQAITSININKNHASDLHK